MVVVQIQKVEVGEYQHTWTIPELSLKKSNKAITLNYLFKEENITMIVDLTVGRMKYFKEGEETDVMQPRVYFKEVPSNCEFKFTITPIRGQAWNFVSGKMEPFKSYQMKPTRFIDSKNLTSCLTRDEGTFILRLTVEKMPRINKSFNNSILQDMKGLLESKKSSDFTFVVDGEEMKVHKAVLAARSPVFRKLFLDDKNKSTFVTTDISKEIFAELISFVYCGQIEGFNGSVIELLKAADQFGIVSLKKICVMKLKTGLEENKAGEVFQLAHRLGLKGLKQVSFGMIQGTFSRAGKKIPDNFIDDPKKIAKLVSLMKEIDEVLEEKLVDPTEEDSGEDSAVEIKTPEADKKVSFGENDEIKFFENENSDADQVDEEESEDEVFECNLDENEVDPESNMENQVSTVTESPENAESVDDNGEVKDEKTEDEK